MYSYTFDINILTLIIDMKKKHLFLFCLLGFFSCSDESLQIDGEVEGNLLTLRSGGDGIYDVLGYGYDCTQSDFIGTRYARLPVIDTQAYINSGNVIYEDDLHNDILEKQKWGYNFSEFQKDVERTIDVTIKEIPLTSKVLPLFTGFLKTTFTSNEKITSSHCFYEFDTKKSTRKIKFSQTDPSYLKNYLSSTFKYDIQTKSGMELVKKYGTHVLTDILLGGSSRMVFYGKLGASTNTATFKTESELSYKAIKLNSGTTNTTNTVKTHKDMEILVWVIGGNKALDSGKLTFNPFDGTISNLSFGYTDWLNSVSKSTEQIIGIGNPNTTIYPLSEFIFDNPQKKQEVENALIAYAEEKKVIQSTKESIDYETKGILTSNQNLFYGTFKVNGMGFEGVSWGDKSSYKWTFLPEGNLYRIKGPDGYLTRSTAGGVKVETYQNNPNQLWEIEHNTNDVKSPYRIKEPLSDLVLTRYILVHKFPKPINITVNLPALKLDLWNPNDLEQRWSIY